MSANRYCALLGLAEAPNVEALAARRSVNLLTLVIAALLERGAPMSIPELADRLDDAGAFAPSGDMAVSIAKAWHGQPPVYRDAAGRLALDPSSPDFQRIRWREGFVRPRPPAIVAPRDVPSDDVPLTAEELDAAFRDRNLYNVSPQRAVAAVLDVAGRAMTIEEADAVLAALSRARFPLTARTVHGWRSPIVLCDEEGRLTLDRDSPQLAGVRANVRRRAYPELARRAEQARLQVQAAQVQAERAERQAREAAEAAHLRRAVVRVVPEAARPEALAILDLTTRTFQVFGSDALADGARALAHFDMLIGLNVRDTLPALGLAPDDWQIVDLQPPRKTLRLNRAGRTLTITPELLIAATTGTGHPLGDPAKTADYLARRDRGRLARRLESDLKSLYAFYRYGVLHGYVRLRWGFLDERVRVEWALPGERRLSELLREAEAGGRFVDLVVGSAPGWSEPWARAWRVRVGSVKAWEVRVEGEGRFAVLDCADIQAIRLVEPAPGDAALGIDDAPDGDAADVAP